MGRGLDALLHNSSLVNAKGAAIFQEIALKDIEVNPFQPRKDIDAKALQELSKSIQLHGIIQPLTIRKVGSMQYQLIAGERRFRAAQIAGLTHVPAYVRTANDQQMLEMALIENIQRENLNPIEIALSYQRLLTECKIKQETLGARVGKDRTTVNNYLRLLKLPPDVQIALRNQKISMGHARALINIESVATQLNLLQEITEKAMSVRDLERRVRMLQEKASNGSPKQHAATTALSQTLQSFSKKLATHLGTPVKVHTGTKERGEIKIAFSNAQELNRIIHLLVKSS